eukprot:Gregarina_sp_Poly_1__8511@NODE_501_length_7881_cov_160_335552_g401_i0_p1_GENE_NODE_501_length_7881_cov_160_335552_g401_i0NODE_501_length_7881_cov_160_335552_g401_i0_p1_ORF_typecomplete_len908_score162_75DUF3458_C/PF17432_2/1_6e03DUF3458_C/PF17432_2/9_3e71Peptidase_M1/PF01433_20/3_4e55DUF3458/PF11940_8/7_9e23Peptidase_M1_N/PF17900_1/3_6e21DUF2911/PF11138_8/0_21_NODE_501_length_7881_cov_160_335552_g401_i05713294
MPNTEQLQEQQIVYRKDYKRPEYDVHTTNLDVILDETETCVTSTLQVSAATEDAGDLILNGEDIISKGVWINGKELSAGEYAIGQIENVDKDNLIIFKSSLPNFGEKFELVVKNTNDPKANLKLSGLYVSSELLVTQMEAEGFRRFAYHVDRPDSLSTYTVRLEADKKKYPVLLSNGDVVKEELLPNHRHARIFSDPFRKPTYLFAIIAGPLHCIHDTFTTMPTEEEESKTVNLYVWCAEKYLSQVSWAMECVKLAMKWDEEKYGRVYDLSTFSVVAIDDFNAGAMENKSLTTYNVSSVLASRETATDATFERVLTVIGHEYFHNWSGDRVTVRDWFQITLKEGFTNFRETCFSRDIFSPGAKRVEQVMMLRAAQFVEDAGPLAHPIRPDSYVAIDNFYTSTVYDKGSEVIGMLRTLVGSDGFRKGTDLYFSRFDGCAVSCDDFRECIAEANGRDFSQFERWYSQRGTPVLRVHNRGWDAAARQYKMTIEQILPDNADPAGGEPQPLHIPILLGLIGKESKKDLIPSRLLELTEWKQDFVVDSIAEDCVPSFLRDFSAPVKIDTFLNYEELAFLSAYDSDAFVVWDSAQTIFREFVLDRAQKVMKGEVSLDSDDELPEYILRIFQEGLHNRFHDKTFVAYFLSSQPVAGLVQYMKPVADPVILWRVSEWMRNKLAADLRMPIAFLFDELFKESKATPFKITKEDVGRRSLQSLLLGFICRVPKESAEDTAQQVAEFYKAATCFNDKYIATQMICRFTFPIRDEILTDFYDVCKDDNTMLDGWFRVQATSSAPDTLERVKALLQHPDFKDTTTPNRWRAVVAALSVNTPCFHDRSGEGYKIVAEEVSRFDKFNGYTAAIVAKQLVEFANYDKDRQAQMIGILKDLKSGGLSKNTDEVVTRALSTVEES